MWKQKEYNKTKEQLFINMGKGKLLSRLLSQRDIVGENVDEFLKSEYKNLSHPYSLNDCEKAVRLFCEIAKDNGKVALISDYDADGILSSVMIKELCNTFGLDCSVFLPSRLEHGYGLNDVTVTDFLSKGNVDISLLFILDCGTNSHKEVQRLLNCGIKNIVIIDHHLPTESLALNAHAIISWHLSKNKQEMCACGLTFQFIRGIRWLTKKVNPVEFLAYAAIGTIADVSSIMGDNRIIVKNGLTEFAINHVTASGLKALMRQSKIYSGNLTQHDISFKIAPRINAIGRISSPDMVYGLMIERDPDIATKTAEYIMKYNEKRKNIQKEIENEAILIAKKQNNKNGVLVVNDSWHIGVVGIVASKLVETFNKPSVVIGKLNDTWKGSGRSVKGVNIKEILDLCPELFVTYGGHSGAVGATLKPEMVEKANEVFDDACKKYYSKKEICNQSINYYDAMLDVPLINSVTSGLLRNSLYPYCSNNNSEPIFMIPKVTIMDVSVMERDNWRLLTFFIERNGKRCSHPFKFFSKRFGTEIEGITADVLFSFPQHDNFKVSRFSQFELSVTDIIKKEKS